jgi:hypothetical protein
LLANFPAGVEPKRQAALRVVIHIRAQPFRVIVLQIVLKAIVSRSVVDMTLVSRR